MVAEDVSNEAGQCFQAHVRGVYHVGVKYGPDVDRKLPFDHLPIPLRDFVQHFVFLLVGLLAGKEISVDAVGAFPSFSFRRDGPIFVGEPSFVEVRRHRAEMKGFVVPVFRHFPSLFAESGGGILSRQLKDGRKKDGRSAKQKEAVAGRKSEGP